jgi:UPF0042 nucleotide-binding protein
MYRIMSFGFKYSRPRDIEVVDVRDMKNPHHNMRLRPMTGKDKDVQDFVKKDALLDRTGSVAFGCLGGRHRSVAMAELVAEGMRRSGAEVQVIHRELG